MTTLVRCLCARNKISVKGTVPLMLNAMKFGNGYFIRIEIYIFTNALKKYL